MASWREARDLQQKLNRRFNGRAKVSVDRKGNLEVKIKDGTDHRTKRRIEESASFNYGLSEITIK